MASTRSEAKMESMEKALMGVQENMTQVHGRLDKIDKAVEGLLSLKEMMEHIIKAQGGAGTTSNEGGGQHGVGSETLGRDESVARQVGGRDEVAEEVRNALKKIELPGFEGDDPLGWLGRMEQYFEVHETPGECKLKLAYIFMHGTTVHWFRWMKARIPNMGWDRFAEELIKRYGGYDSNPFELMASLSQGQQSIDAYIGRFEMLVAQLGEVQEDQCLGYFMSGLREEIRRRMIVHAPRSVDRAMMLARGLEEELYGTAVDRGRNKVGSGLGYAQKSVSNMGWANQNPTHDRDRNKNFSQPNSSQGSISPGDQRMRNPPPPQTYGGGFRASSGGSGGGDRGGGTMRMSHQKNRDGKMVTHQEFLHRREKGLCFKCGEPYHPMHRCANKSLRVTILAEEEGEDAEWEQVELEERKEEVTREMGEAEEPNVEYNTLELPLYSVNGINHPQTLKMRARVAGREVVAMVDSGASHNFVSKKLIAELGLVCDESITFGVCLGDGCRVSCQGVCRELEVDLGQCRVKIEGYLFELGGIDLILGVDWLRTLGDVLLNWNKMEMRFSWDDQTVVLRGDPTLSRSIISLKGISKVSEVEFCGAILVKWSGEGVEVTDKGEGVEAMNQILANYEGVFQEPKELPPCRWQDHAICIKEGSEPVSVRPYKYAHHQKDEIERMVREMLLSGVIQVSNSPYSSPVILVKKKDGSWRFCIDYRALNNITVADKYPIPVVEELFDELHGATIFTKLDLKSGYHQIRVRAADVHKTAFRTHEGHYEFLVMPFGLKNAPATFQSTMNEVFRPYLRKFVLVFFDDVLIYSKNLEEHVHHVEAVFKLLQQHQLVLNRKKCKFGLGQVEYLGHIISAKGVEVDPNKVECVKQWPQPQNIKRLRGFLGLTGYYRKFIKDYGKIARPLTKQLKKNNFGWNDKAQKAFETLKQAVVTAPVLRMPDFSQEFIVECDASGMGIGAVLAQEGKPIAFYSKALAERALSKSTYERELMALVLAVQHWRHYLLGRKFLVVTDHKPLKNLLQQRITTPDQQYWLAKLLGYELEIKHRAGTDNGAADALSRREDVGELMAVSKTEWVGVREIMAEVEKDPVCKKIIEGISMAPDGDKHYSLVNGCLLFKGRLVIPRTSRWITTLLIDFHATPTGGHSGAFRMYKRIANNFFWP
ncbi:uncharacterized protein [Primulina eburnea]|uniref:uncharacterized protein n=1 Tax=Primulina eburnea TaxID=1245227 RepID=UPI003C6C8240